jgi:carbamoyl-phosphate synthase large subunit
MRAVGEVMSIGKNFTETFQKAIRSLEIKRYGPGRIAMFESMSLEELKGAIGTPSSERIFQLYEALKKGLSVDEGYERTKIGKWFGMKMHIRATSDICPQIMHNITEQQHASPANGCY